jgi:tetratricopeptide (TPR) repeat protein
MKKSFSFWKNSNSRARGKNADMFCILRLAQVSLVCLVIVMGWALNAAAHRRGGLALVRPSPPPVTQVVPPEEVKTSGPMSLTPDAYWKRLIAQEQAGELGEAWKTGLALVNLFPQATQRGPALLKLADLAKRQGKTEEALELYGLAASLTSGTPEAAQASLGASALEFSRDLHHGDPVQTLRRFVEKVSALPSGCSSEILPKALTTGWQAVARKVRATTPLPLPVVEEILALWDLQPQGVRPPEAARLVADILKENGLWEEAQTLLAQGDDCTGDHSRKLLQGRCQGLSWPFKAGPGVSHPLNPVPGGEEMQKSLLSAWPARRRAAAESSIPSSEGFIDWLLPQRANAAWLEGKVPGRAQDLLHPWPAPLAELLPSEMARCSLADGHFLKPVQINHLMADKPTGKDLGPFDQDRLGVRYLHDGHSDSAQATFQELSQQKDPFWRRLAQVRLADLELSRLKAESFP